MELPGLALRIRVFVGRVALGHIMVDYEKIQLAANFVSDFHVGMEPSHAEVWPSWRVCGLRGAMPR